MIAATSQPMGLNNLPINWFDVMLGVVLCFGLWRGRRNGMSKEVMLVLQWLTLVLVSGIGYPLFAPTYANTLGLGKVASAMLGYCTLALATFLVFYILKGIFVPRLTGSNFFGGGEYYLGMLSGMIRFACMLLAALALLNAPSYTAEEITGPQRLYAALVWRRVDERQLSSRCEHRAGGGFQTILHRALHQEITWARS